MTPTIKIIIYLVATLSMIAALWLEVRRDTMMLQQNSYRRERYLRWIKASGDSTSWTRLLALILFFAGLTTFKIGVAVAVLTALFGICQSVHLVKKRYKKPLAVTNRVKRLFIADFVVIAIVVATALLLCGPDNVSMALRCASITMLGCYCLSHVFVIGGLVVASPFDKAINKKFYNKARAKLQSLPQLKIVGITGSYGKTSTKHYLNRILSEHYDTLMTPGSYNTTLGVVRTINEHLKPYNEVFIVEMGAKQKGDIAEICKLVNPQVGIITAVGPQHLETFGNINNVCNTKFELADALPKNGLAVLNNDFEPIASRKVDNVDTIRYGIHNCDDCNYVITDIKYSPRGSTFVIERPQGRLELTTSLLGECNISNIAAAVAVATHLGVPDKKIQYAVARIEQVEHRLSSKKLPGGITLLDDAFNSNPTGSSMALDVLSMISEGKRIVITPGMIELGDRQIELNKEFGRKMAKCADLVLIIGEYNKDAIKEGLDEGGMPKGNIHCFAGFMQAYSHAMQMASAGDVILIENDLPDTFK